ncbi:YcaO-like family protein [Gemmobacter serpentinus]|uniref:YcaO-like family protein n=1 Tax=Gemmobacter serpentinus TaxID=2652247 RepID=UPI00124C7465|nr:YcaO-like family protein [Gemmobacter serpentinus]
MSAPLLATRLAEPIAALARDTRLRALRSPFAPGLAIAAADWHGARPILFAQAIGTGLDWPAARARALGEIAENLCLHPDAGSGPCPVLSGGQVICTDARADPGLGSEGVAVGPDLAAAQRAALCERAERAALALWWQGRLAAARLSMPPVLFRLRMGAAAPRQSLLLNLPFIGALHIRLAISDDGQGGQAAMGSAAAADPAEADEAALREMCQAELAWLLPPDHPDCAARNRQAVTLARRLPALLAAAPAPAPAGRLPLPDLDALHARGLRVGYADLTHPQLQIAAARFICPDWPSARDFLASF